MDKQNLMLQKKMLEQQQNYQNTQSQQQYQQQQQKYNQYRTKIQSLPDIDRNRLLYEQRFIDNNYKVNNTYRDATEDSDDDEDDDDEEDIPPIKVYSELQHCIAISSFDRSWELNDNSRSQYNFQVKFAPSGNRIINKPLYLNNMTIPATPTQAAQGLRGNPNTTGWFSSTGTYYQAYNPSEINGPIVDYEKIVEIGQRGLSLDNAFKNIVSVELVGAIFPTTQRQIDYYPDLKENIVEEQYYTMEIDEFSDIINGTNKDLTKAFAILTPLIRIYELAKPSSKSIEYKTIGMWQKKFITPLSSLTNLSIKLKKPSGDILKNLNDVLDVKFIYQYKTNPSDVRTDILVIETVQYFSETEYKPTDTIVFRNYNYRKTNIIPNSHYFNDYINRQKGHKILSFGTSDPSKFLKNRIYISKPAYLDTTTGDITEEDWYTTFKLTLENESELDQIVSNDDGRFINLDLQNIYFFNITTKEQTMVMNTERV
jgi:hypothetical protein